MSSHDHEWLGEKRRTLIRSISGHIIADHRTQALEELSVLTETFERELEAFGRAASMGHIYGAGR